MGKLDEDLREVLRIKAASDAVYMWGGEAAAKKVRAAETACFNFVHEHAYKILGLYHLNEMMQNEAGSKAYAEDARYYRDAELEDLGLKHGQAPAAESATGNPGHDAASRGRGAPGGAP